MIELPEDKFPLESRILTEKERFELDLLKSYLRITDFFSHNQAITFSWDNKHIGANKIIARMEKFYVFSY